MLFRSQGPHLPLPALPRERGLGLGVPAISSPGIAVDTVGASGGRVAVGRAAVVMMNCGAEQRKRGYTNYCCRESNIKTNR